jgi:hypothetical protein
VGKAEVHLHALGEGSITLRVPAYSGDVSGSTTLTLGTVWYCPDCPYNLLSTRRFVQAGHCVLLMRAGAMIFDAEWQPKIWMDMDASGLCTCYPAECTQLNNALDARQAGSELTSGNSVVSEIVSSHTE